MYAVGEGVEEFLRRAKLFGETKTNAQLKTDLKKMGSKENYKNSVKIQLVEAFATMQLTLNKPKSTRKSTRKE